MFCHVKSYFCDLSLLSMTNNGMYQLFELTSRRILIAKLCYRVPEFLSWFDMNFSVSFTVPEYSNNTFDGKI